MTGPSGPSYRTAAVARANVTQTLMSTGTIEPVSQASVSFPVSGQVASVSVGLGSHVRAGQVLAQLSTTALVSEVSAAQYSVATDTVRLAADEASQTASTSTTSAGATTSGAGGQGPTSGSLATITKLQAVVRAAQQRLDAKLTSARALLHEVTAVCAATPTPTSSPTGAGSPSPAPSPSAISTVTVSSQPASPGSKRPGGSPDGSSPPTCQAATSQLLSAETSIAAVEQSLANSESDLSKTLSKVSAGIAGSAGSSSGGGSGSGSAAGSPGSAGRATAGAPATAAQLAADQASLDAAQAQLSAARQNLAAATLVAPITGTVALVNITPGQQAIGSQGSGTAANFVIEGGGGQEAVTTVSDLNVGKIRVGQSATVTLDGSATSISGTVVAIGMLSTSSTGNGSYPVTISLPADAPTLFAGSDAQVTITLAEVHDAITVPTSAVQGTGAATFVTVLRAGKPVSVRVVTGAASPALTQISSGLTIGEQVVLADMNTPLPTNTNRFVRGLTTGGGNFGRGSTGSGTTGGGTTPTGSGSGG
ncbi:MAG TPA: HlyD family efflux transporter periplasmic adaptor subunit [Streptosporangiaceae bacterium]|nr:HlyD family efflux transporter periplasmic adaptor subunit [Streptosporangiaceae bacterium]